MIRITWWMRWNILKLQFDSYTLLVVLIIGSIAGTVAVLLMIGVLIFASKRKGPKVVQGKQHKRDHDYFLFFLNKSIIKDNKIRNTSIDYWYCRIKAPGWQWLWWGKWLLFCRDLWKCRRRNWVPNYTKPLLRRRFWWWCTHESCRESILWWRASRLNTWYDI